MSRIIGRIVFFTFFAMNHSLAGVSHWGGQNEDVHMTEIDTMGPASIPMCKVLLEEVKLNPNLVTRKLENTIKRCCELLNTLPPSNSAGVNL